MHVRHVALDRFGVRPHRGNLALERADHLDGANVLSHASGTLAEVLEYYPFGGTRLDQRTAAFSEQSRRRSLNNL
jgi:hypothetical protein